jgi:serine/threonine protein kinase/tetratricopeptide (TPR) repeat protein
MTSERLRKIKSVFEAALDHGAHNRTSFLREECKGDPSLIAEVEKLLNAHAETDSLLDRSLNSKSLQAVHESFPATLPVGSFLCQRYKITRVIGRGGMGAVYEANDIELSGEGSNPIAIKVILPEYSERSDLQRRFKEEIALARRIAHRNVVRIFNLEIDGSLLFLTMEFVRGENLATLLEKHGPYSAKETAQIMYQAASGMEAAHQVQIIHRDLKTRNIMLQPDGRVVVTDFGLARPLGDQTRTETAGLMGTFAYMAPEQFRHQKADQRSDLYSLGVVFHELLTGKLPSLPFAKEKKTDFVSYLLPRRVSFPAVGAADRKLSGIVRKCLEEDPDERYQSAGDLREDIAYWLHPGTSKAVVTRWKIGVAALALLAVGAGVWAVFERPKTPPSAHPPVTLLISDFANRTGDPVFSGGTLESILAIELERSPFISSYSRASARNAAKQLQGSSELSEVDAHQIAVREGIQSVVSGSLDRDGSDYALEVRVASADGTEALAPRHATARSRDAVLPTLAEMATDIRRDLGEKSMPAQRAETFTASSLEAIHAYEVAQRFALGGKRSEAISEYRHAILMDPNLGRAYAGLAVLYRNKNQPDEALRYFNEAMKHVDRMTDREKYRTRGGYYITSDSPDKAIDEYSQLVKLYPADNAGQANLALAWSLKRDMTKATEYGRKALDIYPKNVAQRTNLGWYLLFDGKFREAADQANQALQENPKFEKAYIVIALAKLAQGDVPGAQKEYNDLRRASDEGASSAAIGLADIAVYQGRIEDAVNLLQGGAAADQATGNRLAAAEKLAALAETDLVIGKTDRALDAASRASGLGNNTDIVLFQLAQAFVKVKPRNAQEIASAMTQSARPDTRCYGTLIKGELDLENRHTDAAIADFEEALKQADSWLVRYDLGRAYIRAKKYPEADSELEVCLRRQGEAAAVFMDDTPTYRIFPPVYYFHGLAEEGLGASARSWFKMFLDIKASDSSDPMVEDARQHFSSGQ